MHEEESDHEFGKKTQFLFRLDFLSFYTINKTSFLF